MSVVTKRDRERIARLVGAARVRGRTSVYIYGESTDLRTGREYVHPPASRLTTEAEMIEWQQVSEYDLGFSFVLHRVVMPIERAFRVGGSLA